MEQLSNHHGRRARLCLAKRQLGCRSCPNGKLLQSEWASSKERADPLPFSCCPVVEWPLAETVLNSGACEHRYQCALPELSATRLPDLTRSPAVTRGVIASMDRRTRRGASSLWMGESAVRFNRGILIPSPPRPGDDTMHIVLENVARGIRCTRRGGWWRSVRVRLFDANHTQVGGRLRDAS